jgi:hypothetical protein
MRAIVALAITIGIAAGICVTTHPAGAQDYLPDMGTSGALTNYLHLNSLPMVTAQVSTSTEGNKQVVLSGFVATQFGLHDAERITLAYLGDPSIKLVDQIAIDPAIENVRSPTMTNPASSQDASPPAMNTNQRNQQWNKTMQGIYKNGEQSPPAGGQGPMLP